LKLIGAVKFAQILQEAIEQFPGGIVPQDDEERREILQEMGDRADEAWEKLDDRFFEYPEDLNQLNMNYVRQNKESF